MSKLRSYGWELAVLSLMWLGALVAFLAALGLHFYASDLVCWSGPDYAPNGTTFLSLWPPGPGCSFTTHDQPPSLIWSGAALLLVASGAWLLRELRGTPRDSQQKAPDVA